MANQMIALQARNPQLPDPARQTAQMANMMNMASQQRASQLQAERIRQEMEYETELQAPKLAEAGAKANSAQLTFVMDFYKKSADSLLNSSTPEQAVARGERLKSMFPVPALQAQIDETITDLVSDPSQFQAKRKQMLINTLDAKDQLAVEHSDIFDAEGNLLFKEASKVGAFPTRLTPGVVTDLPSTATRSTSAPRATPPAAAAPMRATQGANTTPQDLIDQGMNPNNIPSGMPTARPISFNQSDMGGAGAAQMTPDVMSRIVDSAFNTGVMAQVDFDQLLASQPPQNKQALVDSFQRANIRLQADAPSLADSAMGQQQQMAASPVQRPQAGFADMRGATPQSRTAGLGGDMPMERTLAQYQIGQQVKGRNPNLSPYPGSAQVPIERVRQEAIAGRESPAEAAAKAAAAARATAVVEAEKKSAEKLPGRKQVSTIIKKIRGAYEELEKREAIASEKRGGFANVMDYLATTTPGREVQKALGTSASKYLSEIVNSRKLLATAIKNATGMSAQEMNSNVELQLTLDALTDPTQGIEAARSTLDTLEELYGAPRTASAQGARRTPTLPVLTPEQVRTNPNIKRWKTTDGRIMTRP